MRPYTKCCLPTSRTTPSAQAHSVAHAHSADVDEEKTKPPNVSFSSPGCFSVLFFAPFALALLFVLLLNELARLSLTLNSPSEPSNAFSSDLFSPWSPFTKPEKSAWPSTRRALFNLFGGKDSSSASALLFIPLFVVRSDLVPWK